MNENITDFFEGKSILVTGGAGSIGSMLVKKLLTYNPAVVRVLDNSESALFYLQEELKNHPNIRFLQGDIRNKERVKRAMHKIDYVFNASALKHVPICEYNPYEAVKTNVIGTQNLVESARDENVKLFMSISTDKAVNPVNTMGATKLLSEKLVLGGRIGDISTKFSCVRFGNVLNSNGSVIPTFKSQVKKGIPVTVTSEEMTRFFMSIDEATHLILKAATITDGNEVFILKMPALRIIDLAKTIIKETAPRYGKQPKDIEIEITGIRPGEKLHECLLAKEEIWKLRETDDMYVLRNMTNSGANTLSEIKTKNDDFSYSSDGVSHLNQEEIKEILVKYDIL